MNNDLKNLLNKFYEVCDSAYTSCDLSELSLREIFNLDILKYVLYLGAADDNINQEKVDFISMYLDWNMSISQWCEFINQENIHMDSFLNEIPLSFEIFVEDDNHRYSCDNSAVNGSEAYIWIFEKIGELFIETGNNVDRKEQIALEKYKNMLSKYYQENTIRIDMVNGYNFVEENEYIHVKVANRTIIIPKALPETIKRMQELLPLRNELIQAGGRVRDTYDPEDIFASPMKFFETYDQILEKYNDKYKELMTKQYGESFFMSYSKYKADYAKICSSAETRIGLIYKQQNERFKMGMSIAEIEAEEEMKGMSFGIITNSLTSALLYTGMSAVTYASQAIKAQQTYDRILHKYSSDGAKLQEVKIINKEIVPLICPVAEKTTAIFLHDVLEEIDLNINIDYDNMDDKHKTEVLADEKDYIYGNTQALKNALKKLSCIKGEKGDFNKIIDIIEECPYCPEAYLKLIQMNIFDIDVFKVAKIVGIEGVIIPKLLDVLSNDASDGVVSMLEIIAMYKSQSLKQVIEQYYKNNIEKIKNKYKEAFLACSDIKMMAEWVNRNVETSLNTISEFSVEKIEKCIKEWVNNNLPKNNTIQKLCEMEFVSYEDMVFEGIYNCELDKINNKYKQNMIKTLSRYVKEVKEKKKAYEDAYAIFNEGEKERKALISVKKEKLKKQGFFAFSKKKKIKSEIDGLEKEYEEYCKTEPVDIKNAYFNM